MKIVFENGDTLVDVKSFDGIDKLSTSGQMVSMGTNGATLTLEKLDELIDKIKGGKPDMLLMSKRSRRKLTALSRATGSGILGIVGNGLMGIKIIDETEE